MFDELHARHPDYAESIETMLREFLQIALEHDTAV